MNKIKVIIPARGGSKGLRNKHIQLLNNKPLIFWTLDQFIKEIGTQVDLYISTDCDKIINLCLKNYSQVKILRRDKELALDNTSTEKVLENISKDWIKKSPENEYVIYASACEINRPKGILKEAINFIENNKQFDTFMYGEKSHKHLWENFLTEPKLICDWMKEYNPRQLDKANYLIEHTGLILITKLKYWLRGERFGGRIFIKELNDLYRHVDIHNRIDLEIASAIVSS